MPYITRLHNLRLAMLDRGIDTTILTPGSAMRYLTGFSEEGFERLLCLVVPGHGDALFIAPSLNAVQARENPAGIGDVREWGDSAGWTELFAAIADELELGVGVVAVDENMAARFVLPLQGILSEASFETAGEIVADLRMRKDAAELDSLKRAGEATDAAYLAGLAACKVGATERDVAAAIESAIAERGAKLSFETIVAAGDNGALPHHMPTNRKLAEGDIVIFDLGAKVDGYCGDITRVVSIGEPSVKAREVYDTVYRAQQAATFAVKPGVSAESIDVAARNVIVAAGYGEKFIHRTGHGIGLDDHEHPNIVAGNAHLLRTGECFSIEPGIYLPGEFGVRLENIVTVTANGVKELNAPIPPTMAVIAA